MNNILKVVLYRDSEKAQKRSRILAKIREVLRGATRKKQGALTKIASHKNHQI